MAICIVALTSTTLAYQFEGRVTFDDLAALRDAERPHFEALPRDAHLSVIVDFSGLDTIPADLLPQLPHMRFVADPRVSVVIVVGANPYLRALAISLGMIVTRPPFVFRRTMDEAMRSLTPPPGPNTLQSSRNFTNTSVSRS